MQKLAFTNSFSSLGNEPAILLASKLAKITPGDLNAVFFTSGGTKSNDTTYKLVRYYRKLKGYDLELIIHYVRDSYCLYKSFNAAISALFALPK
ncbi:aminotransferase [Neobacillus massiliamazoniensis]|uniref:Aminotransferase n=1 Tax=Neobacillus massiliamazoniensis TaxID=1499688 RepID=A0A0U1NQE3_9BACI|nr:aminotransferase [Neobacillus massiliamazoniensis]